MLAQTRTISRSSKRPTSSLAYGGRHTAVSVASLGVLFAIAAIVVGVILFRQSDDYREMIAEEVASYKTVLHAHTAARLSDMATQRSDTRNQYEEFVAKAHEQLRAVPGEGSVSTHQHDERNRTPQRDLDLPGSPPSVAGARQLLGMPVGAPQHSRLRAPVGGEGDRSVGPAARMSKPAAML